ncbi:ABC transporter permease [Phytoactinopolyspora limicola]|uniref:ABC transporter permease n=1 Tax=Phytoactinopolyspora limicola TaxID=2715536 RepID=UPI00140B4343|nr:ABC transporter permease [Phytoactinopolyspora limicola]
MPARDVIAEAIRALRGRPLGALLATGAVALGVAGIVGTVMVSAGVSRAVTAEFDALNSTLVTMIPATSGAPSDVDADTASTHISALNGVEHAGAWGRLTTDQIPITRLAADSERPVYAHTFAAGPAAIDAYQLEIVSGRHYDDGHQDAGSPVAVVHSRLAADLGITEFTDPMIFVDEVPVTVIGTFVSPSDRPETIGAVIIPPSTASALFDVEDRHPLSIVVRTQAGAAASVVNEAPVAANPVNPDQYAAVVSAAPRQLRGQIEANMRGLLLGIGAVAVAVGTFGIGISMTLNTTQRMPEIGVRRATGATRSAIAGQFLVESAVLGLIGGLVGAWVAVVGATVTQLALGWTPVAEPLALLMAPLLGIASGVLAGLIPARRASRMNPADVLRM